MRRHLVGLLLLGTILFLAGIAVGLIMTYVIGIHDCSTGGGRWDEHLETCVIHDR